MYCAYMQGLCHFRDSGLFFVPTRSTFVFGRSGRTGWSRRTLNFLSLRFHFLLEFRFFCVDRCVLCMCMVFVILVTFALFLFQPGQLLWFWTCLSVAGSVFGSLRLEKCSFFRVGAC